MIDKNDVKTAQPFSDGVDESNSENVTGGEPNPRPDTRDSEAERQKAGKMTQREE